MTSNTEAQELQAIEDYLKNVPMTCKDFLARARVGSSTWARIKTGETIPNGATMNRIRSALTILKKEVADREPASKKKGK